jgi:CheY-like chemotaxis protein
MQNLHVLTLAAEKEALLRGVDEFLHERDIPIRFDRVKGVHQALEKLSERSFDAIVCVVERADELAVVVRLRKGSSDTPILLLTDALDSEIARWGKALGANEVLKRSSSREAFAETLRRVLETRRLIRQNRAQMDRTLHLSKDIAGLAREANRLAEGASKKLGAGSRFASFAPILVEDNVDEAFLMVRAFAKTRLPGPIEVLKDGEEAIAYLSGREPYHDRRRHPLPTLVILDLHLPKKNGFDVLEWIRRSPRLADLAVVVLSSSSAQHDMDRATALGANLYLVKPVGLDGLMESARAIAGYWAISNPGADPY